MPASSHPLVSVIVPTYNRAEYLREAIASILAQTYAPWELIVVNDGSSDGTSSYLAGLNDERVHVVTRPQRSNAAVARNAGIAVARGDYVAFLDSDDLWMPEKLELQVERLLESASGCRWSYTLFGIINERGEDMPMLAGGPWMPHDGFVLDKVITTEVIAPIPTVVAERELVLELGGFDETLVFGEDLDLRLRLAARSRACAVSQVLCKVREHSGRTTYQRQEIHFWWIRVYEKFRRNTVVSRIRKLCRQECANHLGYLANHYAGSGAYRKAIPLLLKALRYRPADPWLWQILGKTVLRPITPTPVLRAYRKIRGTRARKRIR